MSGWADWILRGLGLASIPLTALMIWGLIRQTRREQPVSLRSPALGLVMGPLMLLINLVLIQQAAPAFTGPALLVLGLGFGLAWGQTARLYARSGRAVARRSVLHLVFWAASYSITQLLATIAPAWLVAGGLAAMFFSTGSSLGTNLNLLIRQLRPLPLAAPVSGPAARPGHPAPTPALGISRAAPPDLPR